MNRDSKKFLLTVVGADGLQALTKASEKFPELSNVFLPRAIISWLSVCQDASYSGKIPGLHSGNFIELNKSEPGRAVIGEDAYSIDPARPETLVQVAAAIAVQLGADQNPIPEDIQPEHITKMAKSLDLLVKSKSLAWLEEETPGENHAPDEETPGEHHGEESSSALEKGVDLPGKAAGPRGPEEPEKPETPKKQPSMGVNPGFKVTRSENFSKLLLKNACAVCGKPQLHERWNTFQGCECIADLVKHEQPKVQISLDRENYRITADSETILALEEILREPDVAQ